MTSTESAPLPASVPAPDHAASAATASAGRREQNKAATREAIAAAAVDLLRRLGPGAFTVEQVAEAAKVSRRTFFNYFPSIEAALMVAVEDFLEEVITRFHNRPAEEPILESMLQVLARSTDTRNLARLGEVYRLACTRPELRRVNLEAWDSAERRIVEAVAARAAKSAPPLYTSALVASVLAAGRAAMEQWMEETGGEPSDASVARLNTLFLNVITYLRDGFAD